MRRFLRILQFVLLGAALGGLGGLLLPTFREQETAGLGLSGLTRLGLLGALMASVGPLVEHNWKKLLTSSLTGAVSLILLILALMGVHQLNVGGLAEVLVIIVAAGLFPALVALTDCLMDELYRAILYETFFSALGGMLGLAFAWLWTALASDSISFAFPTAIYSAVIWLGMGLAKRVEESEEKLEAQEEGKSESP